MMKVTEFRGLLIESTYLLLPNILVRVIIDAKLPTNRKSCHYRISFLYQGFYYWDTYCLDLYKVNGNF